MIDRAAGSPPSPTQAPKSTPAQTAAPASADKVKDAVADIRNKLKDGGFFEDDVTNGELKDIAATLKGLNAGEANQVLSQLSDAEINKITDEIDSSGIGNFGGLSKDEKTDLVGDLAGKLDAKQFERVTKAFDDPKEIGDIVAAKGSNDAKLGFINAYKADASSGPQGGGFLDAISGTTHYGNDSARAIGTVLGSMDPAGLAKAIGQTNPKTHEFEPGALSRTQLRTVMDAGLGETSHSGGIGGGGSLPAYSFDSSGLNKILDAAARSGDAGLKAEVFQGASKSLEQVQGVGGFLTPAPGSKAEAGKIADHMSSLLRSDTSGIVTQLESADPTGKAITPFARQQLADGKTADLREILTDLRNGPNGHPEQFLQNTQNAQNLGYALGGVAAGLASLDKSNKEEAALLGGLISSTVGNLPYGGDAISFASQSVLDNTIGAVSSGAEEAPDALYELISHGMAADVQRDMDSAMSRVIDLRTLT